MNFPREAILKNVIYGGITFESTANDFFRGSKW